jgi:hypothetical protein
MPILLAGPKTGRLITILAENIYKFDFKTFQSKLTFKFINSTYIFISTFF